MTGRGWITASLKKIGVIAPGESLSASEATDGLAEGNRMISSWSNDGLLIYAITTESPLTLTAGDGTVTLGTSGDITTRPMSIESAVIRDGTTDMPPMRRLTAAEYAAIPDKSVQSDYPEAFFEDGGYPQRTVTLYPVPASAKQLVLQTRRALTSVTSLDTDLAFPPGYEDALIYNLSVRLAPEYGKTVPPEVTMAAIETKAAIQRVNDRPSLLRCDSLPVGGCGGSYDITTGGYR